MAKANRNSPKKATKFQNESFEPDTLSDALAKESVSALAAAAAGFADILDEAKEPNTREGETPVGEKTFSVEDEITEEMASDEMPNVEMAGLEFENDDEDQLDEDPNSDAEGQDDPNLAASSDDSADAVSDELANYATDDDQSEIKLENYQVISVIESLLFASDKPVSFDLIKQAFKGTNIKVLDLKRAIEDYRADLAHGQRGVQLEDIGGGYQIRTKSENVDFLRRSVKNRVFKLSGPALEVMAIVAYQQPIIKSQIDEIRGVDSGHLLRALMDRGLVKFAGKSEFPGRPMLYETSRKFLEIFGLRNIRELPSLSEIDDLIPEGIGEVEPENRNLGALTESLSLDSGINYSQGEDELLKISAELSAIDVSSEFFEQEKARAKRERDGQRAQDIREAALVGQTVERKDQRWLDRYEKELVEAQLAAETAAQLASAQPVDLPQPSDLPSEDLIIEAADSKTDAIMPEIADFEAEESKIKLDGQNDSGSAQEDLDLGSDDLDLGSGDLDFESGDLDFGSDDIGISVDDSKLRDEAEFNLDSGAETETILPNDLENNLETDNEA